MIDQRMPREPPQTVALWAVLPTGVAGRKNDPPVSEAIATHPSAIEPQEERNDDSERGETYGNLDPLRLKICEEENRKVTHEQPR